MLKTINSIIAEAKHQSVQDSAKNNIAELLDDRLAENVEDYTAHLDICFVDNTLDRLKNNIDDIYKLEVDRYTGSKIASPTKSNVKVKTAKTNVYSERDEFSGLLRNTKTTSVLGSDIIILAKLNSPTYNVSSKFTCYYNPSKTENYASKDRSVALKKINQNKESPNHYSSLSDFLKDSVLRSICNILTEQDISGLDESASSTLLNEFKKTVDEFTSNIYAGIEKYPAKQEAKDKFKNIITSDTTSYAKLDANISTYIKEKNLKIDRARELKTEAYKIFKQRLEFIISEVGTFTVANETISKLISNEIKGLRSE